MPVVSEAPRKQARQRRSHVRTFTGCQQCRQRHVKCDEGRPTCENCTRMGIDCSAYPFKIDMRVFTPKSLEAAAGKRRSFKRRESRTSSNSPPDYDASLSSSFSDGTRTSSPKLQLARAISNGESTMRHQVISQEDDGDESIPGQMVLIPAGCTAVVPHTSKALSSQNTAKTTTIALTADAKPILSNPPISFLTTPSLNLDTKFFSHFLSTVSTLLIVYDNPHNANPYRLVFPSLARDSQPLQEAMNALGALHLANTTPSSREVNLKAMAISRYSRCVHSLREVLMSKRTPQLADLATVLLLTFFEMMDSDTNNWQTHLRGAKHLFEKLFDPSTVASVKAEKRPKEAVRNFLISALGYLDVAAAASTAQTTQLEGAYWDRVGGGWQYNLGVPSLNATLEGRVPEDDNLKVLRKAWSQLMTIQADVGKLATEIDSKSYTGLEVEGHKVQIQDALSRWRTNLPEIFDHLDDAITDQYHADSIEGAACVVCYESATIIYFHQVAGTSHDNPLMDACIDTISRIFVRYGHGVSQMGMLWALFIAGTQARDAMRQDFVRVRMQNMLSFGLGNVKRALQLLELVWLRGRQAGMESRWFVLQRELQWTLLLP